MTTKIDDGGAAFQTFHQHALGSIYRDQNGMSLRDWFAGQVVSEFVRINERVTAGRENVPYSLALKVTAEQAYALADAMLAARRAAS